MENATKTIQVNRIEWYIPSDVNEMPNLPDSVCVSLSTSLGEDGIQAEIIRRKLIRFYGFVPRAFSYRSIKNNVCGFRDWKLSSSRTPAKELDNLAAQIKSQNAGMGCYGSGSPACLNLCNRCD